MTVGDFANARGEFASDPYTPRTRAGAPVKARVNDAPLPKTLDVAILASQTTGSQGMSTKTADLRRK